MADAQKADVASQPATLQQENVKADEITDAQKLAGGEREAVEEADEDDGEGDGDDDGDEDAGSKESSLNAKQKKKKKSKAAAKLRKRLGLASNEGGASSSSVSAPVLTDDQVKQLQQAVEKEQGPVAASKVDRQNLQKLMEMMNLERDALQKSQESKQKSAKAIADHKFWKTQPVTKFGDAPLRSISEEGPIQPNQPPEQIRQEPYPLPSDFEWVTVDIDDPEQLKEVYNLLSGHYVEDDNATLRFNYSPEFFNWVLRHPGFNKLWHVGVRVKSTGKLIAFISGIPHELRVREQSFHSTEINFLCVHKKLRSKRLAPVLIKEVTRRCNLTGVFQAIYTVGAVLPTPISCARYYHRTINAEKLLEIGFSSVPIGMTKERYFARYTVPEQTQVANLRPMEKRDVAQVGRLMRRYMRRFDMGARFSDDEVDHIMLGGRGIGQVEGKQAKQVLWTYVVDDPEEGCITDVFSYYSLPSSVLDSDKHKTLEAAYLFYYATDVPFQSEGFSSARPSAEEAASKPSDKSAVPQWQQSPITGLSSSELADEKNVTPWDKEDAGVKQRLKSRLNELMQDLFVLAKREGFDVVNCLTVMDNPLFLQDQKFGPGDGFLRFYLFNWRVQPIAGGMGSRAGEAELDPVVQHLRASAASSSSSSSSSSSMTKQNVADEEMRRALENRPRPELGSGNGIVMV